MGGNKHEEKSTHTVSWDELSSNIYVDWNEDFIEKFQSKLNWNNLSP